MTVYIRVLDGRDFQLVRADVDQPVGCGLFDSRLRAAEWARRRGWVVIADPVQGVA